MVINNIMRINWDLVSPIKHHANIVQKLLIVIKRNCLIRGHSSHSERIASKAEKVTLLDSLSLGFSSDFASLSFFNLHSLGL